MPDVIENESESEVEQSPAEDLRGDITAAYAEVEASTESVEAPAATEVQEASEPSSQPRGADGKYAKKSAEADGHGASDAKAEAAPVEVDPSSASTGKPVPVRENSPVRESKPEVAISAKAPQSWRPAAREAWAALPESVKAEISRREGETSRVLTTTDEARKFQESFRTTVAPYEQMLRSEGAEPMQAMQNLLETARQLRSGDPGSKAALVAQIVRGYGVPIEALDAALAGQPMPQQAQQQFRDPRLDGLLQQIEQSKTQRAANEAAEADSAVTEFGAAKEFFADVRDDMADIIELAEKRGQKMDLEAAYKRACGMNDEISTVVRQREAAKAAATGKAATQRSKAASSSVKSSGPPPTGGPEAESLREQLWAAYRGE
jgi:hypothetical protein